ncbi:ClC family H(+)/Cl(-) exchange transporter [Lancefieldella rimae]|uniref:ClC family H(+)/Cl(-) exchange transporter n=1 Tax=Lancefieldella rimae TaxID=1383 RepID=UPI001CACEA20|nr:ClC family H(+)/Cl(-) exchange transporter [Lancefieldella rimae]MBF4804476.1 ClC family H(+)/Cl(-) exchange transporter [Lancefieldella rimae]
MTSDTRQDTSVVERHFSRRFQVALVGEGALVGLLGGGVVTLYRLSLSYAEKEMRDITGLISGNLLFVALWFLLLVILSICVGRLVKWEPLTSGSGIPQTNAEVIGHLNAPWYRVLPAKFIEGVLVAFGGLSMGREGPSVQLGGMSGKAISKLLHLKRGEEHLLVTCGAAAGMSAAFHAPLTGTLFAVEEIQKEFHAPLIISAMTSSVVADFLVSNVFGMKPVIRLDYVQPLPHIDYVFVLFVGIICGVLGALHNKGMFSLQKAYGKINVCVPYARLIIPFIIAGFVALSAPDLLCGGDALIEKIKEPATLTELSVLALLVGKYAFTTVCFSAGTPGGTLFPLVVMGTLLGTFMGLCVSHLFGIPMAYVPNFVAMGVAGVFASVIRAPVTAVVLVFELTGSLEALAAMTAVSVISYTVANVLRVDPFYDHLLAQLLNALPIHSDTPSDTNRPIGGEKILQEYTLGAGSCIEGMCVKDVPWPDKIRIVTIERAGKELIPTGNTRLQAFDSILVILDEAYEDDVCLKLDLMTRAASDLLHHHPSSRS